MSKTITTKAISMVLLAALWAPAVVSRAEAGSTDTHHQVKKKRKKNRNNDDAEQRRRQREREERRRQQQQQAEEEAERERQRERAEQAAREQRRRERQAREQAEQEQRQRERARRKRQEEEAAAKAERQRRRAQQEAAAKEQRRRERIAREEAEKRERQRRRAVRKKQEDEAAAAAAKAERQRRKAQQEAAAKEQKRRDRIARRDAEEGQRQRDERSAQTDAPRKRGPERTKAQAQRIRERRAERQAQRKRVIEHYLSQMDEDSANRVRQQLAEGGRRIGKDAVDEVARLVIEGERPAARRLDTLASQVQKKSGTPASENVVHELSEAVRVAHKIKSLPTTAAKKGLIHLGNMEVERDGQRTSLNKVMAAEIVKRRPELAGSALAEDPVEVMVNGLLFLDEDKVLREMKLFRKADGSYTTLEAAAASKSPRAVAAVNRYLAARNALRTGEGLEQHINELSAAFAKLQ